MKKHYSVRKSRMYENLWKIVIAGGWFGYNDTDTGYFKSFEEACRAADKLNESMNKGKKYETE